MRDYREAPERERGLKKMGPLLIVVAFALIAVAVLSLPGDSDAAPSGKCGDDLVWELDGAGNLVISGSGDMYDFKSPNVPWGQGIKSVHFEGPVTSIGNNAFDRCTSLASVSMPSATSVGEYAFYNCASLESVRMDSAKYVGMKAFSYCQSLKAVDFPAALREIGNYAFFGSGLTSVAIPGDGVMIGASAFSGCTALTSVAIPDSVSSIGKNAFYGIRCLDERGNVLDVSAGSLGGYAYEGSCCVLQRVADGFEFVSGGLVYKVDWSGDADATLVGYSDPVAHLSVPASVSYGGKDYPVSDIGPKAFYGCGSLISADLGSVSEIGMKAFARCAALESVDFGDSLETIGAYAFYACDSLASAAIPDSAASVGKCAFSLCPALSEVVIPDSAETIGDRAFYGCGSISSITIGISVASIGPGAFHGLAFFDESGIELPPTAEALAGHLYAGDGDGRLFRVTA